MPGFLGMRAGARIDLPPMRPAHAIGGRSAFVLFDRAGRMVRARNANALRDRNGSTLVGRSGAAVVLRTSP
jgi:hypothetical protein